MNRISVVLCTKNAATNVAEVLESVKANNPYEIILVDGRSNDDTVKIATPYCDKIFFDTGMGLGEARRIAVNEATGDYIFFLGPDNILFPNSLEQLRVYLNDKGWAGVGMLTKLRDTPTYLAKGMDLRWNTRIFEGERDCVGTPYLYRAEVLKKYNFNIETKFCDDTDLCFRIVNDGHKIGYSNIFCLEIGVETEDEIRNRFYMYGESDYQFYKLNEAGWSEERKDKSRRHGFDCEYCEVLKLIENEDLKIEYEPFFKQLAMWRVEGWNRMEQKEKDKNKK